MRQECNFCQICHNGMVLTTPFLTLPGMPCFFHCTVLVYSKYIQHTLEFGTVLCWCTLYTQYIYSRVMVLYCTGVLYTHSIFQSCGTVLYRSTVYTQYTLELWYCTVPVYCIHTVYSRVVVLYCTGVLYTHSMFQSCGTVLYRCTVYAQYILELWYYNLPVYFIYIFIYIYTHSILQIPNINLSIHHHMMFITELLDF